MDILSIFNYHHRATWNRSKNIILSIYQKHSNDSRPFSYFYNDVQKELLKYCDRNFTDKNRSKFPEAFTLFEFRQQNYGGSADQVIKGILENEIADLFKDISRKEYRNFVVDMARISSLREIREHHGSYSTYYELVYETKCFEYFYFTEFENRHYSETDEYKRMLVKKFPERRDEIYSISDSPDHEENGSKDKKSSHETRILKNLEVFTDKERLLLIHFTYEKFFKSKQNPLSLVDFIKLIKILGAYEDLSLFYERPKNNTTYQKVNKGLDYYSKGTHQEILRSLLSKIDILNSSGLKAILTRELTNLNKI